MVSSNTCIACPYILETNTKYYFHKSDIFLKVLHCPRIQHNQDICFNQSIADIPKGQTKPWPKPLVGSRRGPSSVHIKEKMFIKCGF